MEVLQKALHKYSAGPIFDLFTQHKNYRTEKHECKSGDYSTENTPE